jgi:16S rRNA processing protein RimM
MICVGKIGAAVGIKGQVRLISFVEDTTLLTQHPLYYGKELGCSCTLRLVGMQKNIPLVMIDGVTDRTQAEMWRHTELYLPRNALPHDTEDGEYYISDLIGMQVCDPHGAVIGQVKAVHNFGAGDIIEILFTDGKEDMLLFTEHNFPHIDMDRHQIVYHPPEIVSVT